MASLIHRTLNTAVRMPLVVTAPLIRKAPKIPLPISAHAHFTTRIYSHPMEANNYSAVVAAIVAACIGGYYYCDSSSHALQAEAQAISATICELCETGKLSNTLTEKIAKIDDSTCLSPEDSGYIEWYERTHDQFVKSMEEKRKKANSESTDRFSKERLSVEIGSLSREKSTLECETQAQRDAIKKSWDACRENNQRKRSEIYKKEAKPASDLLEALRIQFLSQVRNFREIEKTTSIPYHSEFKNSKVISAIDALFSELNKTTLFAGTPYSRFEDHIALFGYRVKHPSVHKIFFQRLKPPTEKEVFSQYLLLTAMMMSYLDCGYYDRSEFFMNPVREFIASCQTNFSLTLTTATEREQMREIHAYLLKLL